jgi:hypothetical protein
MAITAAHLTSAGSDTNADTQDTASITPTANRLVLAAIVNTASGTPTLPTLAGNGLTWVEILTVLFDVIATPTKRLTLFRALGASPSTGVVTITAATSTGWSWSVAEFGGIDTSGSNGSGAIVQSASNRADNAGSLTVTLAAFADAVNNVAYGGFGASGNTQITPGGGFAELGEGASTLPSSRCQSEWKTGQDTTVDASTELASPEWGGIAVEIKMATAAAAFAPRMALLGVGR